jgi:hypothetical protein
MEKGRGATRGSHTTGGGRAQKATTNQRVRVAWEETVVQQETAVLGDVGAQQTTNNQRMRAVQKEAAAR